jgi:hypothetical protein
MAESYIAAELFETKHLRSVLGTERSAARFGISLRNGENVRVGDYPGSLEFGKTITIRNVF